MNVFLSAFATAFKFKVSGNDFVLISVNLKLGNGSKDKARRKVELSSIAQWIDSQDEIEKDFFILGDMNFKSCAEITERIPENHSALKLWRSVY